MSRNLKTVLLATVLLVVSLVVPACSWAGAPEQASDEPGVEQPQGRTEADVAEDEAGQGEAADDSSQWSGGESESGSDEAIDEDGTYTSKDEVALYLHTYGHLPNNYVTKDEAEDAGWKTEGLNVDEACPGKSIGGNRFGNREGRLPAAKGRTWYECDIDYAGGRSRGPKRIVYSNDGLIYYTEDHYETFEQLY